MGKESICPICEGLMYGLHCKVVCPNCGYREDCSDLFPHRPPEPRAAVEPAARLNLFGGPVE